MQDVVDSVQRNCDVVDARYGGDYGMCTYLLKMRELYRWEQGLPLGAPLEAGQGLPLVGREVYVDRVVVHDGGEQGEEGNADIG